MAAVAARLTRAIEMARALRALVVLAATLGFAACTTAPTPSAPAATVTEQLGRLQVTHLVAWTPVPGPGPVAGAGLLPQFYLTNTALTVTCPPPPTGALFEGCPAPVAALPAGGVLVTVSDAGSLFGAQPPDVTAGVPTDDWPGPCKSIGGERQVSSVLDGVVVSACLRGPDLDAAEASVRAMIASLAPAS